MLSITCQLNPTYGDILRRYKIKDAPLERTIKTYKLLKREQLWAKRNYPTQKEMRRVVQKFKSPRVNPWRTEI